MATYRQFIMIDKLAEHGIIRRTVAWDSFGSGHSPKPTGDPKAFAEAELLEDTRHLLTNEAGRSPRDVNILVAHSFGTNLALQLAAHPELRPLIHGMVLLGPAPTRPASVNSWLWKTHPWVFNALRPIIGRGFMKRAFHPTTPRHVLDMSTSINASNETHVIQAFYRQVTWHCAHVLDKAEEVLHKVPTVVAVGESDAITPPSMARAVAARLPWASLHTVPAAGHMVMMEQPGEVLDMVVKVAREAIEWKDSNSQASSR